MSYFHYWFFFTFKAYDIYVATAATILVTLIQLLAFYLKNQRVELIYVVTVISFTVFGGLTILFHNDIYIKWKPTIVYWVFTVLIAFMMFTKKTAIEYVIGKKISLPRLTWRRLNLAWGLFFFFLGVLNLYIAFYYDIGETKISRTQLWINFKVFGMIGLILVFIIAQIYVLRRYLKHEKVNGEYSD